MVVELEAALAAVPFGVAPAVGAEAVAGERPPRLGCRAALAAAAAAALAFGLAAAAAAAADLREGEAFAGQRVGELRGEALARQIAPALQAAQLGQRRIDVDQLGDRRGALCRPLCCRGRR